MPLYNFSCVHYGTCSCKYTCVHAHIYTLHTYTSTCIHTHANIHTNIFFILWWCDSDYGLDYVTCITVPGLNITWKQYPGQLALGGIYVADATTVEACKDICVRNGSCLAIDFDTSGQCFIHVSPQWSNNIVTDKPNVDQYVLNITYPETSAMTSLPTSMSEQTLDYKTYLERAIAWRYIKKLVYWFKAG